MGTTTRAIVDEQLLRPLQALSLKLYFESDSGMRALWPERSYDSPGRVAIDERRCTAVAKRVSELVQRFGHRKFTNSAQDVALQRDAWKHVLKFLFLLRAIGPGSMIYGTGKSLAAQHDPLELPVETRRYRLTVMDVLVDYIRHKCSVLAGERNPAVLLAECNQIVSSLYIIFDGDSEFVTLTLLKMDLLAGSGAVALMYPVFEQVLASSQPRRHQTPLGLMDYVRLLLCYKKWKAMVPARRDKAAINSLAIKVLPARCPGTKTKQDLPFVQMLPRLSASAKGQDEETRFLLAKDLMEIEQLCAIYFREYEKRFFQCTEPKLSALEIKSNYINIDALAEFIQRKCNLLRGIYRRPVPSRSNATSQQRHRQQQHQQLQHESNAIVSSLRLIFRRDEQFIALTLLRVETCPDYQSVLGPVYERFLANRGPLLTTNNVESYGRLLLCYVKWKRLYLAEDPGGHWERIDRIALATLPYDIPRAVKRKELALKALFPRVAAAVGRRDGQSAKVSVTRALLNSKHVWSNIHEMCLKFLAICRDGRTNRVKALPVPNHQTALEDEEVEIIKTESNSISVLDSDDETDLIDSTDTDKECSIISVPDNNRMCNETLGTDITNENAKFYQPEHSLLDSLFNTPPPTPKADETQQEQLPVFELTTALRKVQKPKKMLQAGVNFKISKNLRIRSNREQRDFLAAFRKLSSKKCFHIKLSSELTDYCLLKKESTSMVFVEVISFGDVHPGAPIQLAANENGFRLAERSFTNPPSITLEEPILQDTSTKHSSNKQRTLDDQLRTLITDLDDLPLPSPASVDFTVFAEERDRLSSIENLTNDQAPPSSVVDGYPFWHNDVFSIFANLDFNPWLEHDAAPFSSTASFV